MERYIFISASKLHKFWKNVPEEILKNSQRLINLKNRRTAIKKSISLLKCEDILIIAGKGHEKYQIIKDKRLPFDDLKIAKSFLTR